MSSKAAARALGIAEAILRRDRSSGHLGVPYVCIGRTVRYSRADLDAWLRIAIADTPRRGRPPRAAQIAREKKEQEAVERLPAARQYAKGDKT